MPQHAHFCPYCDWRGPDPKPKTGDDICPRCGSWRVEPVQKEPDKNKKPSGT